MGRSVGNGGCTLGRKTAVETASRQYCFIHRNCLSLLGKRIHFGEGRQRRRQTTCRRAVPAGFPFLSGRVEFGRQGWVGYRCTLFRRQRVSKSANLRNSYRGQQICSNSCLQRVSAPIYCPSPIRHMPTPLQHTATPGLCHTLCSVGERSCRLTFRRGVALTIPSLVGFVAKTDITFTQSKRPNPPFFVARSWEVSVMVSDFSAFGFPPCAPPDIPVTRRN